VENLTTFKHYGRTVNCYFTINADTKDFESIRVIDGFGQPVALEPADIEKLKDLLTEDVVFATMQFQSMIQHGEMVHA
jgi:hypothetical protein